MRQLEIRLLQSTRTYFGLLSKKYSASLVPEPGYAIRAYAVFLQSGAFDFLRENKQ
ncbi:hypothetical protein AA0118_g4756 [Alternaria tenuissima]|nr:hypothetical protein AA0118_g4756 [Alternaria tenuissima]